MNISPFAGLLKALQDFLHSRQQTRIDRRDAFVLGSLSGASCIAEPDNGHNLSFSTIDSLLRSSQRARLGYAERNGIPSEEDPHRPEKIQDVLQDMSLRGRIRRTRNHWTVEKP